MRKIISILSALVISVSKSFTGIANSADSKKPTRYPNTQLVKSSCNGLCNWWNYRRVWVEM